ncbi:MAG: TolC family protein [Bacteroidales bacterium]|nr:TolC family protein [Bacteroidales bacterium]
MKKKRLVGMMIGLLLGGTALVSAQQEYSLDECVRLSLKNNLQMKNGRIDLQSVDSRIRQAKSGLLPSVDVTGQYQYYLKMPKMLVPAEFFGGNPGEFMAISLGSEQTSTASMQISQVLYNQKVFIGLKAAQTAKNLTELQIGKTREDLIYNVSAVYYNLQVVQQNLNLLDSNIVTLNKMLTTNTVLQANQIISKNNLKRLQINYENLGNERRNLQLTSEKAYNLLKFLLGLPLTENIRIQAFQSDETIKPTAKTNVEDRTDLRLMKEQIELAEIDKKATVADYFPSLSGVYNYGITGYNDKVDPFRTFDGNWMKSSYVGLQLNVPVFSGGKRLQSVRQKEFDVQKARNNYELMKQSAEKEISDATSNYQSSANSFENSRRNLELAQDVFNSSYTEYSNGLLSLSDMLQIQNELTTARNNYSTSFINLRIADIELKKAKGDLLNMY